MILGLAGYKNCGKDTVGAYLVKERGFERRSFADKLKESAAALFGVPAWELDKWKNEPDMEVLIARQHNETPHVRQSVRSMLQRYGTESHRDIFGENFWVDQLLPVEGFYGGRAIVVTDVRFENEIDRVISLGGHIIFIDRPGLDYKDPHRSEGDGVELAKVVGYHLDNSKTIHELFNNVETMLEALG